MSASTSINLRKLDNFNLQTIELALGKVEVTKQTVYCAQFAKLS